MSFAASPPAGNKATDFHVFSSHQTNQEDAFMGTTMLTPPVIKEPGEYIKDVINIARAKNPAETEFLQAVVEVLESLGPVIQRSIPNTRRRKSWRE